VPTAETLSHQLVALAKRLKLSPDRVRLKPFAGRAYKFYLLLPRKRRGRDVFTERDTAYLTQHLNALFGGLTTNDVTKSPVIGLYEVQAVADRIGTDIDLHRSFTVYTKPTVACRNYFIELDEFLRAYLLKTRGIQEELLMIEMSTVEILNYQLRRTRLR
jgi:hypothetical protein